MLRSEELLGVRANRNSAPAEPHINWSRPFPQGNFALRFTFLPGECRRDNGRIVLDKIDEKHYARMLESIGFQEGQLASGVPVLNGKF